MLCSAFVESALAAQPAASNIKTIQKINRFLNFMKNLIWVSMATFIALDRSP